MKKQSPSNGRCGLVQVLSTAIRSTVAVVGMTVVHATGAAWCAELPWPERGGLNGRGAAIPEEAKDLPTSWNEAENENIAWKIPLEGEGHCTPVIGQGRIWLTAANKDGTEQFLYCIDADDGKILHHKLLFENAEPEKLENKVNTYASPTCVLEPDAVYVHFGSYGTARVDPETCEVIWQRRDLPCRHFRGPGSSPIVFENLLILTFDGIDQQYLTALDKRTGETVWRTDRTTDYDDLNQEGKPRADGDLRKAYSTPSVIEVDGVPHLVSCGSKAAFGYDARTGRELWTITHDDFNASARPLLYGQHVIICTGSARSNLISVRLDPEMSGNVDKTHVVWDRVRGNSDLSSPLLVDNRVYMVANNGVVTCVDAETGEEVWRDRFAGTFIPMAVTANGLLYYPNEEGATNVIRAADQFEVVAKNELKEGMRASPAIAGNALYLRTFGHLYKIAKPRLR